MKLLRIIYSMDARSGGPVEGIIRQSIYLNDHIETDVLTIDQPDAVSPGDLPFRVIALETGRKRKRQIGRTLDHFGWNNQMIPWIRQT